MPRAGLRLPFEGQKVSKEGIMSDKETILDVQGMSCPSCIRHVDAALHDLDGVSKVEVRLRDGKVLVRHDPDTPIESMIKALSDAGYDSTLSVP